MKYTINGFQQTELLRFKMDCVDVQILRYTIDFFNTQKMCHKIIDNKIFFWLNYSTVIEELPILGIDNTQVLGRRMKKWEEAGLITKLVVKGQDEHIWNGRKVSRHGTFTYFSFNSEYLASLLDGSDSKVQPSYGETVGLDSKVQPGKTEKSRGAGLKHPTKDSSTTYSSTKDNSSTLKCSGKILFTYKTWRFYESGEVRYGEDPEIYHYLKMPFVPSVELSKKIDEYFGKKP